MKVRLKKLNTGIKPLARKPVSIKQEKEPQSTVFIYVLICPLTYKPRYVGYTQNPLKRLNEHLSRVQDCTKAKREWIQSLNELDKKPFMALLEQCKIEIKVDREEYWTERLRAEGHKLLNIKTGNTFVKKVLV